MLHKCANPACENQYRYFREGVLFEFQIDESSRYQPVAQASSPAQKREIFWLCTKCSQTMTLECREGAVAVAPLRRSQKSA